MRTNIQLKFTPLSGNKCVYQFIRTGVEAVGNPVIMDDNVFEYFVDHDETFRELVYKRVPFSLSLVWNERI